MGTQIKRGVSDGLRVFWGFKGTLRTQRDGHSRGAVGGHPGAGQGFAYMSRKREICGAKAVISHGEVPSLLAPTYPGAP